MLELKRHDPPYASLVRPIRLTPGWLGQHHEDNPAILAGPVIVDVYEQVLQKNSDNLIQELTDAGGHAGLTLHGWNLAQLNDFRRAAWRSAHRYLVENVELIEHGREIAELGKILGVETK